jgi:hypothetical protein
MWSAAATATAAGEEGAGQRRMGGPPYDRTYPSVAVAVAVAVAAAAAGQTTTGSMGAAPKFNHASHPSSAMHACRFSIYRAPLYP